MTKLGIVLTVGILLGVHGSAHANLLVNPDFETGYSGWERFTNPSLGGNYGSVATFDIKGTGASSYAYWCLPHTGDGAGVKQSIFLVEGEEYDLSVDVAAQNIATHGMGGVQYMTLSVGGSQIAQTELSDWTYMPASTIHRATLSGAFTPMTTGAHDFTVSFYRPWYQSSLIRGWVDNAVVLPEPATLSLLALGGLAMLRRKRKQ